VLAAFEVDSYK